MAVTELETVKQMARATWAAGDYPAVAARQLWPVGERIVRHVDVQPGEDVLDVACGSGNAAIRAAQAGGRAVGLDLTPELLEAGRRLAAQAGVEVEWVEGDAEALPFDDATFDAITSVYGCMFAPRHEIAARELARVLRPGGRLGLCNWTPEGTVGDFFGAMAKYLPAPPVGAPPLLWGTEEHVRSLFEGTGIELRFERETVEFPPFASGDEAVEFMSTKFGPMVNARRMTEADGRWPELRAEAARLYEEEEPAEYLVVLGRKV